MTTHRDSFDVAIVGGAFSGAATALLLRRANPRLRVVIVERKEAFDRKVGESAIELASWFLTHVLGLDRHLALEHLPKYGLRFWFQNADVRTLADASELGNLYQTRVPSFHLDRSRLDEHVLGLAVEEGAGLLRPACVTDARLGEKGVSELEVDQDGARRTIEARWIVDATGRRAWLARKLDLVEPIAGHATRSIWARYRGVRDFDGDWLPGPRSAPGSAVCSRGLSTNHLMGPGWWVWIIPLPGGETSVGVVWDENMFDLPAGGTIARRFEAFMDSFPAGRELLGGATRLDGDLHALNHLPYRVRTLAGDGWALVGDAAGFLDPFYSPGLDWAALTVSRTVELVGGSPRAGSLPEAIDHHNRLFTRSFQRWYETLYEDRYQYMGDFELMAVALRLEVSMYYLGVVTPPYRDGLAGLEPPFGVPASYPFYKLMRFVHRRLAGLGRTRRAAGSWGRANAGRRLLVPGFKLGPGSLSWVPGALARLALLEIRSLPDRLRSGRGEAYPSGAADITTPR